MVQIFASNFYRVIKSLANLRNYLGSRKKNLKSNVTFCDFTRDNFSVCTYVYTLVYLIAAQEQISKQERNIFNFNKHTGSNKRAQGGKYPDFMLKMGFFDQIFM